MKVERKIIQRIYKIAIFILLSLCLALMDVTTSLAASSVKDLDPSADKIISKVRSYILSVDQNPGYSSIWNLIGMSRSDQDIPEDYKKTFYNNMVSYLEENNWDLNTRKYSDYSKLILGFTAIGIDAQDVNGHNLLYYLSDFSNIKIQGFNGPIWALIALNSHPNYGIPDNKSAQEQTTRELLITYLLKPGYMKDSGGWSLYNRVNGAADVDITAMTIQALAPYYSRSDVKSAIDKGLQWLASVQLENGGFTTMGVETSESDAQVIVALSAIGIDCQTDPRFITSNGSWVMSRLFEYYSAIDSSKGGFMHVFAGAENNGGGAAGTIDGMATEQGMYATVAYQRMLEGKTALYDMSDIDLNPGKAPDAPSTTATTATTQRNTTDSGQTGTTARKSKKVKVTKLTLNYNQITLQRGKTRTLKLKIYPTNATSKKVKWKTSNKKIATVTQKGKVKGVKAGKADITVTARDGSKKKTVCKVVVKNPSSGKGSKGSGGSSGASSGKRKVTDVSLNYKQISVAKGASRSLSAVVAPSNASNKKLAWSSSNKSIATVNQSGIVTGKSVGTVTITAKAKDGSKKSASCTVVVYGAGSSGSGSSGSSGFGGFGQSSGGGQQGAATASGRSGVVSGGSGNGQGSAGANAGSQGNTASGTGAGGQAGQAAGASGSTNADGSAQTSTEAGAWSFDGAAYVPESAGDSSSAGNDSDLPAGGDSFAGDNPDLEEDAPAEYAETISGESSEADGTGLPIWLELILGLAGPGAMAGAFVVPWSSVREKLLLLAASRRKDGQKG